MDCWLILGNPVLWSGDRERVRAGYVSKQVRPNDPAESAYQLRDLVCGTWLGDEIALNFGAPLGVQQAELPRGLNAFSDSCDPEAVAHPRDRADDRGAICFTPQAGDEALVDLDFIERKAAQVTQRRVAG